MNQCCGQFIDAYGPDDSWIERRRPHLLAEMSSINIELSPSQNNYTTQFGFL